jgi:hypothetical protein
MSATATRQPSAATKPVPEGKTEGQSSSARTGHRKPEPEREVSKPKPKAQESAEAKAKRQAVEKAKRDKARASAKAKEQAKLTKARAKLAEKAGPAVAAILLSGKPVKQAQAVEAVVSDLQAAGATKLDKAAIVRLAKPLFDTGLVAGYGTTWGDGRWAGKSTVERAAKLLAERQPQRD